MAITKGNKIISADGQSVGIATGGQRRCSMEGCLGRQVAVRWPDGRLTYPCTKGMSAAADGSYQIIPR